MPALDMLRGRQTATRQLTNKSGGGVALGDVVVIGDGANDDAFTTTTSAAFNSRMIGVAMETIANDAVGLVAIQGYVPKIVTNASATRDYFLFTHTVAKQATSSATRASGAFGQVLASGTSPAAILWGMPDSTAASGAPSGAKYIVGAADGTLSAERVRTDLYYNYDPDTLPASLNAVSNEFDGTAGGTYTWTSAPTASDENTTVPGYLYVEEAANSSALYYRASYAPGATNFSVAAKLSMAEPWATNQTCQVGIALLDSGDALIWRALLLDDGTGTSFYRYFDTNLSSVNTSIPFGTELYLLIQRTSGNVYTGFFSLNGKIWIAGGSSTVATTVAKVAVAINSSGTVKKYYVCDFIRVFDSLTRAIGA